MSYLAATAIGIYLLALLAVGLQGRGLARSSDMFNVFGRRAGTIRATAGYLSLIGGGELLTLSQLGYDNGLGVYWFLGGLVLGFLILSQIGDRIRARAAAVGANSLAGYVAAAYGRLAALGLLLVYVVALGSLLIIQFIVGGELLSAVSGVPRAWIIMIMGVIIVLYLVVSGYVAVLSTDVLRAMMMVLALVIIVVAVRAPDLSALSGTQFTPLPATDGWIFGVLGVFGVICAADVWQAAIASRDAKVFRASMIWAAVTFLMIGTLIALLGVQTKLTYPVLGEGESALLAATEHALPSQLGPLVALLIVGSVMATADTEIWVLAASGLGLTAPAPTGQPTTAFNDVARRRARLVIPLVTAAAVGLALAAPSAQALYSGLLILLTGVAPPMLAILFWSPGPRAIAAAIWAGIASFAVLTVMHHAAIPLVQGLLPPLVAGTALLAATPFDRRGR